MSTQIDDETAGRLEEAASTIRNREPNAWVTHFGPENCYCSQPALRVTIDGDSCPPTVLAALQGQRLHLHNAQRQGMAFEVVARVS